MSFLVFFLVLAFGTLFVGVSIQMRHMAIDGKKPWGHMPTFLALKLSATAYGWVCGLIGWILVILAGAIYNANSGSMLGDYPGAAWSAIYLSALTGIYAWLWLRNRHYDLLP